MVKKCRSSYNIILSILITIFFIYTDYIDIKSWIAKQYSSTNILEKFSRTFNKLQNVHEYILLENYNDISMWDGFYKYGNVFFKNIIRNINAHNNSDKCIHYSTCQVLQKYKQLYNKLLYLPVDITCVIYVHDATVTFLV